MNQKSFNIFLQSGQRKPGLRRSFLQEQIIWQGLKTIELPDGSIWPLYLEPDVQEQLKDGKDQHCLVSFQVFQDGEFFAIARLFNEELVKEKGN